MSFGLALPTGAESIAEYLDVEVRDDADESSGDVDELPDAARPGAPGRVRRARGRRRRSPGAGSLQEVGHVGDVGARHAGGVRIVDGGRRAAAAARRRCRSNGSARASAGSDDIRPAIRSLAAAGDGTLVAEVATIGRGLRPAELAAVAFPGAEVTALRALRTHQWIEHDGDRREVLALPVVVPAPLVGA